AGGTGAADIGSRPQSVGLGGRPAPVVRGFRRFQTFPEPHWPLVSHSVREV
ncbi:hypothetical protein M9458_002412, partial [Cirrhinus mrigala]